MTDAHLDMESGKNLRSILTSIPYVALLSLEGHEERRANAFRQLKSVGIEAEWVVPVKLDALDWSYIPPAFRRAPRYASHAITMIQMFDEAILRGAECFMHVEDDVVFRSDILDRLPHIIVPNDWKFIYLGGRSWGPRQKIRHGLVRSNSICDLHAVIMRNDMIEVMKTALLNPKNQRHWCDARIAYLHRNCAAYLCRPNLAWQAPHGKDDGKGPLYSNYFENGRVKPNCGEWP